MNEIKVSDDFRELLQDIWRDRLRPKSVLFSYLTADLFGIVRMPTYTDRSYDDQNNASNKIELEALVDSYTDNQLNNLSTELKSIYDKTQAILQKQYPSKKVTLYRAICPFDEDKQAALREYDKLELIPLLIEKLKEEKEQEITLELDILSGWSERVACERYGSIELKYEWKIEDILLVSGFLENSPLESNEWLCINRDRRGLVNFDLNTQIKIQDRSKIFAKYEWDYRGSTLETTKEKYYKNIRNRRLYFRPDFISNMYVPTQKTLCKKIIDKLKKL